MLGLALTTEIRPTKAMTRGNDLIDAYLNLRVGSPSTGVAVSVLDTASTVPFFLYYSVTGTDSFIRPLML
jgi:hypothetical protein